LKLAGDTILNWRCKTFCSGSWQSIYCCRYYHYLCCSTLAV